MWLENSIKAGLAWLVGWLVRSLRLFKGASDSTVHNRLLFSATTTRAAFAPNPLSVSGDAGRANLEKCDKLSLAGAPPVRSCANYIVIPRECERLGSYLT